MILKVLDYFQKGVGVDDSTVQKFLVIILRDIFRHQLENFPDLRAGYRRIRHSIIQYIPNSKACPWGSGGSPFVPEWTRNTVVPNHWRGEHT